MPDGREIVCWPTAVHAVPSFEYDAVITLPARVSFTHCAAVHDGELPALVVQIPVIGREGIPATHKPKPHGRLRDWTGSVVRDAAVAAAHLERQTLSRGREPRDVLRPGRQ